MIKRKKYPPLYAKVKVYGSPSSFGHVGKIRFAVGIVGSSARVCYPLMKIWVEQDFATRKLDGDPRVWYDLRRARVVRIPNKPRRNYES